MEVSYKQLKAFIEVATSSTFAEAANSLHVTQPALSSAILRYEPANLASGLGSGGPQTKEFKVTLPAKDAIRWVTAATRQASILLPSASNAPSCSLRYLCWSTPQLVVGDSKESLSCRIPLIIVPANVLVPRGSPSTNSSKNSFGTLFSKPPKLGPRKKPNTSAPRPEPKQK